ncbi:MAG: protein phosphatase 2C domain-containing protein [Polyangiaceae bacterium]|nr:protein phosphatase 2C domain-containing protein [Polyangiaceae bacterium]
MLEGEPRFEVAGGSVSGRAHFLAGKPNQDAFLTLEKNGFVVGLVADGCGSGERSEVGAWLGVHTMANEIVSHKGADLENPTFWDRVEKAVISTLDKTARSMGDLTEELVHRFFLFTVLGVVATNRQVAVFSLGDGVWAVNGKVNVIGPFPGNAPPYLGHALLRSDRPLWGKLIVQDVLPAQKVESVLIATDGAADWEDLRSRLLPGTREMVGPLSDVWQNDRYFSHPDALRRKLARMNRVTTKPNWETRVLEREGGLLEDDTTLWVMRRRQVRP